MVSADDVRRVISILSFCEFCNSGFFVVINGLYNLRVFEVMDDNACLKAKWKS